MVAPVKVAYRAHFARTLRVNDLAHGFDALSLPIVHDDVIKKGHRLEFATRER